MIHVFGTSHVSQESIDMVEEKIEEIEPEVVALELDQNRLHALLNGNNNASGGPLFVRAIRYFQQHIGKKTGVMPGSEMLAAYRAAEQQGVDVALIDQDIRITVQRLKDVSFWEKLKAGAQLVVGLAVGKGSIPTDVPEGEMIERLLYEMEFKFPGMYRVLVEERNEHMIEALKILEEENDGEIVAFVGAAHQKKVQQEFRHAVDS